MKAGNFLKSISAKLFFCYLGETGNCISQNHLPCIVPDRWGPKEEIVGDSKVEGVMQLSLFSKDFCSVMDRSRDPVAVLTCLHFTPSVSSALSSLGWPPSDS
jgi:hypothetical protein